MSDFLTFTIIGASTAAIYAVIASGLVLTYTTTGVFNFAHGATGMLAAFVYWQLHVDWGWPTLAAVVTVVGVVAPLAGIAIERLMRGLEGTSEATKVVVSISLLFGMIGVSTAVWNPQEGRSVAEFFDGNTVDVGATSISYHQITTIIVAVGVAVGLRFLLYATRVGVAMRAAVDDRPLSQLNGARTVRVQRLAWTVSTMLATTGGVLLASTAGLNAIVLSVMIVNAYAAAIVGRLRSLPLTFVGAVVVGLAERYLHGYVKGDYWAGLRLATPAIILFIALLVIRNPRLRGHGRTREYFPAPSREGLITFCAVVFGFGLVLATTLSDSDLLSYGKIFPVAVIALSLVPLLGFANQLSLCQLSLAGIGAVCYAHWGHGGDPLGLLAAVGFTALVGAIVALPALRLSGIYLALATAAFAVTLDRWIFGLPDFHIGSQRVSIFGTGGALTVEPVDLPGVNLSSAKAQFVVAVVTFVLLAGVVGTIRRSRFGRRLIAQRDSEAACATFGMDLIGTRLAVFALSSAIAGLGGALLGVQIGSINAQNFEFTEGLPYFMLVAAGGAGFISAALFIGLLRFGFFPLSTHYAPWFTKWQPLMTGTLGVGMGQEPSGAAPQWSDGFRHLIADRPVKWATLAALVAAWALRLAELYSGWVFFVLVVVVFFGGTGIAELRAHRAGEAPSWVRPGQQQKTAGPDPDRLGIDRPWRSTDLTPIDEQLALGEFDTDVAADVRHSEEVVA